MSILDEFVSNTNRYSIAICVPAKDQLHTQFAYCLTQLMLAAKAEGVDCKLIFCLGTLIVNQRESLVKQAIEANATHILWLDSDMMFPADTLLELLSHKVPVVAANYAQRRSPVKSVAFKKARDWESYLIHNDGENETGLVDVEAVGMGCMLVDISVYSKLPRPYFELIWDEEAGDHHGEDMYHCSQIIKHTGEKILIDCDVSKHIRHLGDFAYKLEMVTSPPRYY